MPSTDFITIAHETDSVAQVVNEVVEVVLVQAQGPAGPPGDAGILDAIYFSYGDASPAILYTPPVDIVVTSLQLFVQTAFNGTAPSVTIGTTAEPSLLMASSENDLTTVASYEVDPGAEIEEGEPIRAFITPGLGTTAGRCMVIIQYALT